MHFFFNGVRNKSCRYSNKLQQYTQYTQINCLFIMCNYLTFKPNFKSNNRFKIFVNT